jgi:DNA-3-methyladenine glycosylase II
LNNALENNRPTIVNSTDVEQLIGLDPLFDVIRQQYGIPPNWSRPEGFVSLSKFILEQQVSLASANAHFKKLNDFIHEFTPENLQRLSDEDYRDCHISRQKAKYLRDLSEKILSGDLDLGTLPKMNEMDIRNKLTQVKGIGQWTSDVYMIFCLQHKDIFPIGDIAVVNSLLELTDAGTKEEMMHLAKKWKPLRSLAVYFLWHYYLKKRNRTSD